MVAQDSPVWSVVYLVTYELEKEGYDIKDDVEELLTMGPFDHFSD